MDLKTRIDSDFKTVYKSGDTKKTAVLRLLKSALLYKQKEHGKEVDEQGTLMVVKQLIRQHKDSLAAYEQAGRNDLAAQEQDSIVILNQYLPKQLEGEALQESVKKILESLDEESRKNYGLAMKAVMAQLKDQADGGEISKVVKTMMEG